MLVVAVGPIWWGWTWGAHRSDSKDRITVAAFGLLAIVALRDILRPPNRPEIPLSAIGGNWLPFPQSFSGEAGILANVAHVAKFCQAHDELTSDYRVFLLGEVGVAVHSILL